MIAVIKIAFFSIVLTHPAILQVVTGMRNRQLMLLLCLAAVPKTLQWHCQ